MTTFEQGWAARPFKEQFPRLDDLAADTLDRLNMAVVDLYMRGLLTDSEVFKIRNKRFPKVVAGALGQDQRPRTGGRLTRYPPSERQAGWWYCSPEASTVGPFATEDDMEVDIRKHYIEP